MDTRSFDYSSYYIGLIGVSTLVQGGLQDIVRALQPLANAHVPFSKEAHS